MSHRGCAQGWLAHVLKCLTEVRRRAGLMADDLCSAEFAQNSCALVTRHRLLQRAVQVGCGALWRAAGERLASGVAKYFGRPGVRAGVGLEKVRRDSLTARAHRLEQPRGLRVQTRPMRDP